MIAAAVLVLGACGGGGGDSLRDRYISGLNALCDDFRAREGKIGEPKSIEELAEKGPRIARAFDEAIANKIGTLEAPPDLEADARRLAALSRKQSDALHRLVAAARKGRRAEVLRLSEVNGRVNAEAGVIGKRIGAKHCSR
jgi:hypothetical protein